MKQLIIAADDFGITKSVNEGIVRAHEDGIVTSLNLLPSGEAYDDALVLSRKIGLSEAGAHLSLTETMPVSDPAKIPSLVGADGRFCKRHAQFILKYVFGAISLDEVYTEWHAQLARAIGSGIKITNLSSHEHLHMLPGIFDILVRLAKENNIRAIRYPHADRSYAKSAVNTVIKKLALSWFAPRMERAIKTSGLAAPEHFRGFFDSGNITEATLLGIVTDLEDGATELVCHPGFLGREVLDRYTFHKNSEAELFALTSRRVKKSLDAHKVELVSYDEFLSTVKPE